MNCEDVRALLPDLLYNELDAEAERPVREHLDACADCEREFDSLGRTLGLLDELTPVSAPPESDTLAVFARAMSNMPHRRGPRWQRAALVGMAAGLLLFVGLLAVGADIQVADGRLSVAFGRSVEPAPAPASDVGSIEPALRRIVHEEVDGAAALLFDAFRGELRERDFAHSQREIVLASTFDDMQREDRLRFDRLEQATAGAIEASSLNRNMLDDVIHIVAKSELDAADDAVRPHKEFVP